ncbi:molybdenum cofactor carrier protein [Myxococcus sp. K38C18041901]|uniref:SLOG cluster 4 domain-containing protein n=1 Tax=Myxococcus guangdongensis TaxID=2906760 RepID=UPI0020A7DE23|nr:molybdenum cofactor carrier protein [Myxococcus guangdongensis]MCP3064463.1 molybdenum cofactor carrier protein [Myxococcus guangdongensis]
MRKDRRIIGVFGSGRQEHLERVIPLARWIAEAGFDLLTGAGSGVMRAAADAFVQVVGRRGISIGIVPGTVKDGEYVPRQGYPNPGVELAIYTHLPLSGEQGTDPLSRNHINVLTPHALVALPGGAGTAAEAVLCARYGKPIILFGPHDAFRRFPSGLERTDSLERVAEFLRAAVLEPARSPAP